MGEIIDVALYCAECKKLIEDGEIFKRTDKGYICEDCIDFSEDGIEVE